MEKHKGLWCSHLVQRHNLSYGSAGLPLNWWQTGAGLLQNWWWTGSGADNMVEVELEGEQLISPLNRFTPTLLLPYQPSSCHYLFLEILCSAHGCCRPECSQRQLGLVHSAGPCLTLSLSMFIYNGTICPTQNFLLCWLITICFMICFIWGQDSDVPL